MNKYLEQLVLFLSKMNQEIDSFEPKMESISKTLKDAENKIAKFNVELNNLENEIQDVENQKVQNNAHISEFSAKIKSFLKSGAVKTKKKKQML